MRRLATLLALLLALPAMAQTRQPASITTIPSATPQSLYWLDSTGAWQSVYQMLVGGSGVYTTDGASLLVQSTGKTAASIYSPVVPPGWNYWANVRSVVDLQPGTTTVNASGYDYYVYNNMAHSAAPAGAGVGLFGLAVNAAAGAKSWGFNPACGDSYDNTVGHSVASTCIGAELDFTNYNNGTTNVGVSALLQGPATSGGDAFTVGVVPGSVTKWTNSFVSNSGAASVFGIAGALSASGVGISSQPLRFGLFDTAGTGHYVSLQGVPAGALSGLSLLDPNLANGVFVTMAGAGGTPIIQSQGSDASVNLMLSAKSGGALIANSILRPQADATLALGQSSFRWSSVNSASYNSGAAVGVTCSGTPTSSFASVGGIVTHC